MPFGLIDDREAAMDPGRGQDEGGKGGRGGRVSSCSELASDLSMDSSACAGMGLFSALKPTVVLVTVGLARTDRLLVTWGAALECPSGAGHGSAGNRA